jgi:hypothetical protein
MLIREARIDDIKQLHIERTNVDGNLKKEFFEDKVDFDHSVFTIYAAHSNPTQLIFISTIN